MYEQFKNQFLTHLAPLFTVEQLKLISAGLDVAAKNYTIKAAEMSLTVLGREEMVNLVKTYLVVRSMEGLSKQTLEAYFIHLRNFTNSMTKPVKEITANDIRLYLFAYQQRNEITNRSLEAVRGCLSTFFSWVANEKYIEQNPMLSVKPIKYEKRPRQALTQMDLEYIRRACGSKRETAIIEMLYSTGCRVSELACIKLTDIDWSNHSVALLGKGNKHRVSYINAKAEVAVKEYLKDRKHQSEYLFCNDRGGTQMKKDNIEKIMRQISAKSGIQGKRISPHVLRHTTATQAMRSGMPVQDIQQLMGHANISTTMIYASTTMEAVASGHKKFVV